MNEVIIKKINKVLQNDTCATLIAPNRYEVKMPKLKITKSDVAYISEYGLESFVDLKYSLYQEKTWNRIAKEVRKVLPKAIKVDKWTLHDDYIFEMVSIAYPTEREISLSVQ